VQAVAFAKHGIDAALNANRRGVSLQFQLCVLEQMWGPADAFLTGSGVTQHIAAKGVFIEKIIRDRSQRHQESWKDLAIGGLKIGCPFKHPVKKRVYHLSFQRLDGDIAL